MTPFARALDALHLLSIAFFLAVALAAGSTPALAAFGTLFLATAILAAVIHAERVSAPIRNLHLGWTLLALPLVFNSIRWLTPFVATPGRVFDAQLGAMDREWFGVDIPRWSEGFLTGPIADPFMALYFLYFLMPVVAFVAFLRRGDRAFTYRAAFLIALGVYACYMLYLLVPAVGPRHAHVELSAPLPRGWITGPIHDLIRDLEPQPFDAFPSCHVVLGLLCAIACWPLGGALRWGMAVVGLGTAASTLVLRYHWFVDDLAALVVVALAVGATRFMDARIARKSANGDHDRMGDLLAGDVVRNPVVRNPTPADGNSAEKPAAE